ncbi:hypothetical protein I6A84_08340 [Frankia sp. CNm7]|uniref:Uncharacterized protein n=1 Tax=Frankia nepalensis TaxID=1836974 RepID=A0A937RJI9_9ACTN|nr:hypothetical protein [Frankia nepalensis]MBL7502276.1 hypothetical protein [Frankia nepalensis]MBL7515746.1 hypothetical protein [Frankia nepalensis]MBL7518127.1 hypothetical protein [Frankia nepalensis]MBL7628509.1 hypothetical protein [Frankia nepalensis]
MYGSSQPQPAGGGYPPAGGHPGWQPPQPGWPPAGAPTPQPLPGPPGPGPGGSGSPAVIRAPRPPRAPRTAEQALRDLPARALGLVGAGLVVLTAAVPWLNAPGLPDSSGLRTASQLWAVGSVLSDVLKLAAVVWVLVPIAGTALWALRWVVRPWAWPAVFVSGVATLVLVVSVLVLVSGADGGGVGVGLWLGVAGASVSIAADILHFVRSTRSAA